MKSRNSSNNTATMSGLKMSGIFSLAVVQALSTVTPSDASTTAEIIEARPYGTGALSYGQFIDSQLELYKLPLMGFLKYNKESVFTFSRSPKSTKTYNVLAIRKPRVIHFAESPDELERLLGAQDV